MIQKNQRGTADAIFTAKKFLLNRNFLVLFGDVPLISINSINKLMNNFKKILNQDQSLLLILQNPQVMEE